MAAGGSASSESMSDALLIEDLVLAVDTGFILLGAVMVFMMQTGFAMLEVGSVSIKNSKNILMKNIGDSVMGALAWWLLGNGLAFGRDAGGFIGTSGFALKGEREYGSDTGDFRPLGYASWLFHWAFAATSTTIVSGAMAERATFGAYAGYSILISMIVYPVVAHWVWAEDGWANPTNPDGERLFDCGVVDFAGSGVVHITGGLSAFVGILILGPRAGRFNIDGTSNYMPAQSAVLQTLGTMLLWWGWLGFNGASVSSLVESPSVAAKIMVITIIGGSSGAISSLVLHKMQWGWWDISATNNGILSGLVSITAGCATLEPEGAFIVGVIGGGIYFCSSNFLLKLRMDDVVDASPVHLFGGLWGLIAAGLFSSKFNYSVAYSEELSDSCAGLFYGGGGRVLAANVVFALAILAWVGSLTLLLFVTVKLTIGIRVSKEQEMAGLDDSKHGGQTFPELRGSFAERSSFNERGSFRDADSFAERGSFRERASFGGSNHYGGSTDNSNHRIKEARQGKAVTDVK